MGVGGCAVVTSEIVYRIVLLFALYVQTKNGPPISLSHRSVSFAPPIITPKLAIRSPSTCLPCRWGDVASMPHKLMCTSQRSGLAISVAFTLSLGTMSLGQTSPKTGFVAQKWLPCNVSVRSNPNFSFSSSSFHPPPSRPLRFFSLASFFLL